MAGKFVNTKHTDTVNSLVAGMKDLLKNPHYLFNTKSATIVTYLNKDIHKSTLDEAAKLEQMPYGCNSPTKYNLIKDFYVYGIEQIQIQVENGEYGAEGSQITGEAIVLPNTIIPYQGDYFIINYLKDNMVFRVTGVSHDTLENGANLYKLTYELDNKEIESLKANINDEYQMLIDNTGTSYNPIIRSEKFELLKRLDYVNSYLREHYISLFYSDRIQSFSFLFNTRRFYDPYMIEFLKKNKVLEDSDNYIYLSHQYPVDSTFSIDYNRSIFRCFEIGDFKNIRKYKHNAIGRYISHDTVTIFDNRPEDYWRIDFNFLPIEGELSGVLPCFNEELFTGMEDKIIYDSRDKNSIYNIIIKHVNGIPISDEDIDNLKFLEYQNNTTLFYSLPLIIYCIDIIIKGLMVRK